MSLAHAQRKERPILFSAPMVRALLAGTKTQTRRIVKPQPPQIVTSVYLPFPAEPNNWHGFGADLIHWYGRCPYGAPGDRMWVRETCRAHELTDKEARTDKYGVIERLGLEAPIYGLDGVLYAADGAFREIENTRDAADAWGDLNSYRKQRGATVPPIHMPRWASRITLEVTGVRVERLQGISEDDARAEGVDPIRDKVPTARDSYRYLFDDINGDGTWAANPWVWVVAFRRVV